MVVGVDVSLRPWAWAVAVNGRWVSGELPDGRDPAGSLREALEAARVRDRAVALAIPMRSVAWDTIPGLRLRSRQARKAAALAAVSRLRVTPREAVVSLDEARGGVMYACAERAAIGSLMAPWLAAGFAVPVVEPAAVSLLRGVGRDRPVVIVRVGEGEVEIVAGSRDRLLFARSVPVAWSPGQANAVRLEVDATIDAARKEGEAVERMLVGGRGDLGALLGAFGDGAGQVALSPDHLMPEIAPWAVAAASAALWRARALKARRPVRRAVAEAVFGRLLGIGARRPGGAGEDHAA